MDRRSFGAKLAAGFGAAVVGWFGIGGARAMGRARGAVSDGDVVWEEGPAGVGVYDWKKYAADIGNFRITVLDYNEDFLRVYVDKPPRFMLSWAAKYPKSGPESLEASKRLAVRYARTVAEFERVNGIDENGFVEPGQ